MKERPILFTGEMVRAILEGRKTMTRRTKGLEGINKNPNDYAQATKHKDGSFIFWGSLKVTNGFAQKAYPNGGGFKCPYGIPGDRLWVRETFSFVGDISPAVRYKADGTLPFGDKWKPSIFMPRWASRILLEITNVRVERLQEIGRADAKSEGFWPGLNGLESWGRQLYGNAELAFKACWDSINSKKYPWASNPWVWVIEFKKV